ncbi:S-layer homology domain-containing protein [Paenibacillus hexagrammi]|uniref:S-layer homology domain-containing protein n=1 Tax=Paenibacillus hexagrammi TaxID=2908839 RepID=A0ABY3SGM6_9BACL|nr:S-layer homology domain-containing protein [Paenibacillus sp. YPD9-1]UJF32615.1 S-layer homology domain-containing protein [Paenibacillus sp. YPD9-1]
MERKQVVQKVSMILLIWCLLISAFSGAVPVYADQGDQGTVTVPQAIEDAAGYLLAANGDNITDWDAYALAKAGKSVPASYLSSVSSQVGLKNGQYNNVTDYARIALAVKAAGGNPEQVVTGTGTYNLIQSIYNSDVLTAQGSNGAIYALQALSSGAYNIPLTAKWKPDKIAAWLLTQKNADGGFPLSSGGDSSIDITASAIKALSVYKDLPVVQQAIEGGVQWLSSKQLDNGGFTEYGENSESTAQVIIGLSAAGVDARSASFTKANGNPLSYLFTYRRSDGGFVHLTSSSASDTGATGQALMALVDYDAFTGGNSGSYVSVPVIGGGSSSDASVTVHVAGPAGILAEGAVTASNAFDAAVQVLQASGVSFDADGSHYFHAVNGISGTGNTWWYYNVKRQGSWDYATVGATNMHDYQLRAGDDVYLYYTGYSTALVQSITIDPALPVAGEAVTVTVYQSVYDYQNHQENIKEAENVSVEINGQTVQTDTYGVAQFPAGFSGGTYQAVVSGYQTGTAPKIAAASKSFEVGTAMIQIEGSSQTFAVDAANSPNLLDSIENILVEHQIHKHIDNGYLQSIESDADAWSYAIYSQGKWTIPMVGMADYTLHPGERAVVYFSGFDTDWNSTTFLVNSITLNPSQPKANESFTVNILKTSGFDTPSPAEGVQVKVGGLTAVTDSQGTVTFAGLPAGSYDMDISGYKANSTPIIVHMSQPITIQPRVDGGTNTGGSPIVYLSVTGDSNKGTILSTRSVALQSGDTPYSLLIRTLGANRVQSSGSGSTAYVQGIDGLREFDEGPLSGWMYAVNGSYLSTGADSVLLKSGDSVSWRYTKDGGNDLNAPSPVGGGATTATGTSTSEVADKVKNLELAYDNKKPIQQISKPAVIVNADKKMSASAAEALKKELAGNAVALEKTAQAKTATEITDAKSEVKLQIPENALAESKIITVNKLSSQEREELVSPIFEFGPKGLTYAKPVQISIKTPLAAEDLSQLALVWLNEETGEWIPIPAVIDAETGTVTGLVNHFTKFAVINRSKLEQKPTTGTSVDVGPAIDRASKWLKNGVELSDWSAYALHTAGVPVSANYLDSVIAMLKEKNGTFRKVTDYERLALSVQAAGGNPQSIGGFNLIERIYNNEQMEIQGTNGPIYGLLALHGGSYDLPAEAKWTPEKLLQWILDAQNQDGSWPLAKGEKGEPDLTAAALAALTPYKEQSTVITAMEKAVKWLSAQQADDGGFTLKGVENAESTAQVIWGLSVSGIDPVNNPQFHSGDKSMLAYLLGLQLSDGSFPHTKDGQSEVIATEQSLMALGAYQNYLKSTSHVSQPAQPETAPVFADQTDIAAWALPSVKKAAAYHIIEGTGGEKSSFEPKKQITRIQFAAILLRILGEAPSADVNTGFTDVAPDSWYAGYVAKAVAKGIATGVSNDRFAPDAAISRQEMAIMLSRALHLETADAATDSFSDLDQAFEGAAPYIQTVQQQGLMEGDESGRFLPQDSATREMAAVVAVRAYELTKK